MLSARSARVVSEVVRAGGGPLTAVAKKPHAIAKIAEGSLFIIMILVAEECAGVVGNERGQT